MKVDKITNEKMDKAHKKAMEKVVCNHLDEYKKYFDDALVSGDEQNA